MPTREPPPRLSPPLLALWSLSQPAPSEYDPPRMARRDWVLARVTTSIVGAAIALVVAMITPDPEGRIVGWMIIGGMVGGLIGGPLWNSIWKRQQDPPRK